jgi:hypothetical protein
MTTKRKLVLALAVLLCAAALLFAGLVSAQSVNAGGGQVPISDDAAYKLAHDTDPHLPLTPEQQRVLEQKEQLARDFVAGKLTAAEVRSRSREMALKSREMAPTGTESGNAYLVPGG